MKRLLLPILAGIILAACSSPAPVEQNRSPEGILAQINSDYFFDKRIWFQDLSIERDQGRLILKGETFYPASVAAAKRILARAGYENVEAQVSFLPDTLMGEGNYGIVNQTKVMGRYRPVTEREEATEMIYGDAVRIVRRGDPFVQIQSPEGYLCYIPTASVRRVDLPEWDRYHRGPFSIFTREVELTESVSINMGSRLPYLGGDRVLLADGDTLRLGDDSYRIADPDQNPKRKAILETAKGYLGLPYVWAGRSDDGVDCSGLVIQSLGANGIFMPRDSDQMSNVGLLYGFPGWTSALLPGDICFFTGTRRLVTHTGIYAGNDMVIHSYGGGTQLESWDPESEVYNPTLKSDFIFARRVFD